MSGHYRLNGLRRIDHEEAAFRSVEVSAAGSSPSGDRVARHGSCGLHSDRARRPDPDFVKVSRMMRNFFFAVAMQGTMQVLTIVIMARFVTGL